MTSQTLSLSLEPDPVTNHSYSMVVPSSSVDFSDEVNLEPIQLKSG
jgi:hypothetical protein